MMIRREYKRDRWTSSSNHHVPLYKDHVDEKKVNEELQRIPFINKLFGKLETFYAATTRFSYWTADLQHAHRVWPRIQLIFWGYLLWRTTEWFMGQPDISNAQGAVLAALSASGAAYGKFYNETGGSVLPSDMKHTTTTQNQPRG